MTTEHVTTIDLSDLRALRVECRACRATIVYQLDQTVRIPHSCPACNADWEPGGGPGDPVAIGNKVVSVLKDWLRVEDRAPFRVRVELHLTERKS